MRKVMEERIVNAAIMGGGVSAVVGLGIYYVICKEKKFNSFSGSSIGALIAVLLAAGMDPYEIFELLKDGVEFFCKPFKGSSAIERFVNEVIGEKSISDLPYRCTIAVTPLSLNSDAPKILDGRNHGFNCGQAVAASAAYPGLFLPKMLNVDGKKYFFVDGGFTSNPPLPHVDGDDWLNYVLGFVRTNPSLLAPVNRYISIPHTELFFAPTTTGLLGKRKDVEIAFYEGVEYAIKMLQVSSEILY